MSPMSEAKKKANKKWDKANLDKILLVMKKGQKDIIKKVAKENGETVNGYINKAIQKQLDEDLKET